LWLGSAHYGGDSCPDDLAPLLGDAARFPKLRSLGLCDSEYTDAIAIALAGAPLLGRLEALDLSLGTLSDEGAEALLARPLVERLRRLELNHHYLSDRVARRFKSLKGVQVNLRDARGEAPALDRYVSAAE